VQILEILVRQSGGCEHLDDFSRPGLLEHLPQALDGGEDLHFEVLFVVVVAHLVLGAVDPPVNPIVGDVRPSRLQLERRLFVERIENGALVLLWRLV
jgi:hypothetical protein